MIKKCSVEGCKNIIECPDKSNPFEIVFCKKHKKEEAEYIDFCVG